MDATRQKPTSTSPFLRHAARAALPAVALAFGLGLSPAQAQSLQDALAQAYESNPTLDAARAQLRATDELVPQARAGYLPTLSAEGQVGRNVQKNGPSDTYWNEKTASATVVQPLFRGGRTVAGMSRAEALVQAQRATLLATEQSVLLTAATAYSDVVRDQAVLDLNVNNVQVLQRQLDASNDRFRVGEITRTDVSQSESRLALSRSNRIAAEGLLNASRATFTRLIGAPPQNLQQPAPLMGLPASLEATIALAEQNNPQVVAARFAERAADAAVDQVAGELLPTVSLVGTYSRTWDRPGTLGDYDTGSITARVSIPIYEAGGTTARVREAKQTASQRRIQIDEATRQARETAIRSWEALVTSRASIKSREEQVRAANIALEGVRQEATVGSRTVLDTLDAEQELLNAQVELVRSQRDEIVASFQVMAAIGQLSANTLELAVQVYDVEGHYNRASNKFWGLSID
ncbi:TolC family outer membrane protein [Niveispirillum fermenti]|uniref:TolC family outer membrane protein n=1 Tax=Niveispirillum fermenti TaxID=1233113 RepID=UPI003A8C1A02